MSLKQAAGWYIGNSGLVHAPEFVKETLTEDVEPGVFPVPLWVNVGVSGHEDGVRLNATTMGMDALGHREFEVMGSTKTHQELATAMWDLASYVFDKGAVFKHGETCGFSATERWPITLGKSRLGNEGQVIRVGMA